jgi:GDPmannose 4,6-dehydratase
MDIMKDVNKNIIITGANGQLGQFLIQYLLLNHPDIHIIGTIRHKSHDIQEFIFDKTKIQWELMDLADVHSMENLILKYKPTYFVNTAGNAYVKESWKIPVQHIEQNSIAVLHQLEAIRTHSPSTRYFNVGSSEEFGDTSEGFKNENTTINPKSPYGCSKAAARHLIGVYRNSYNLYAIQNWTFNFESELRGEKYVTRKITQGVAKIVTQLKSQSKIIPIELGNIDCIRSWQFCGDVADAIWKSLNQEIYNKEIKSDSDLSTQIKEYVVCSSECHSIRELVEITFKCAGIYGKWEGFGIDEKFISNENTLVTINSENFRPINADFINGNSELIQNDLGWKPSLSFNQLIGRMVEWDIKNPA